uniref:Putative secreted protein n=1 Tax=Ixodes ricinus TaxID=34613 RepID=A0A6B0UJX5_IXORI
MAVVSSLLPSFSLAPSALSSLSFTFLLSGAFVATPTGQTLPIYGSAYTLLCTPTREQRLLCGERGLSSIKSSFRVNSWDNVLFFCSCCSVLIELSRVSHRGSAARLVTSGL